MKFTKIAMVATLVAAIAAPSFAGSCCKDKGKKKDDKSSTTVVLK